MATSLRNFSLNLAKWFNRYFWNDNAVKARPFYLRYLFAAILLTTVTCLKLFLFWSIGGETPFLLFFAVIILSTGYGGIGPGIFSTILSALLTIYFFLYPYGEFALDRSGAMQTFVFLCESLLLVALSEAVSRANVVVKKSAERFKALIENIHDAIVVIDSNGKITYVSPGIEQVLGYKTKEFSSQKFKNIFHEEEIDDLKKKFQQIVASKNESVIIVTQALKKNGEWAWIECTLSNLLKHSSVNGVVCTFRNVTERILLEKQKDDFISIATHELKTPVTSIKAYAQILLRRFQKDGNSTAEAMVAKMDGQLNKLISLIGDLLDVTKIEGGRLQLHEEFYNFNLLVEELAEELQRTAEDHKIIVSPFEEIHMYGDKERIGQVLTNLITNAIKYSPGKEDIFVNVSNDARSVTVCVKDKGVGISQENQEKVFERFFRVSSPQNQSFPGLGLGLFISTEIIKRQGGRIWVESEINKGATFCFKLPIDYRVKEEEKNIPDKKIKYG